MLRWSTLFAMALAWAGPAEAAAWRVEADPRGTCVVTASYAFEQGLPARLAFAISPDQRDLHVASWRADYDLQPGDAHDVTLRVDGGPAAHAVARVLGEHLFSIRLPVEAQTVAALMIGRDLHIETGTRTLSFALTGLDAAMRELLACAMDQKGAPPAARTRTRTRLAGTDLFG